jgi:tetratricopeptide (TPR) repeat protein
MPLGRSIDQHVVSNATFARVLWMRGEHDRALQIAEQCVIDALAHEQAIVICYVLIEAAIPVALLSGKRERAAEAVDTLHEISTRMGLRIPEACSHAFSGYLATLNEPDPSQLREFAESIAKLDALGFRAPNAMLIAQYASALGRTGRREEAVSIVDRALERCEKTGDMWFASELYRLRGELSISEPHEREGSMTHEAIADAERYLTKALDTAVSQSASSLQLRGAISLAMLRYSQGEFGRARRVLQAACASFPESRKWPDYQEAVQLLQAVRIAQHFGNAASSFNAYGVGAYLISAIGSASARGLSGDDQVTNCDVVYAAGEFASLDESPPPAMPDWSPVRKYGGFAAWKHYSESDAPLQQIAAGCGCARACGMHGHDHLRASAGNAPTSDDKGFWGALGCACWAV